MTSDAQKLRAYWRRIVGKWMDGTPLRRWQKYDYNCLDHAVVASLHTLKVRTRGRKSER